MLGLVKVALTPPPVAENVEPAAVSFQAISGIYERAELIVSAVPLLPLQKVVAPATVLGAVPVTAPAPSPVNSLPPTAVTSGMASRHVNRETQNRYGGRSSFRSRLLRNRRPDR